MISSEGHASYPYSHGGLSHTHAYLGPALQGILSREQPKRLFEVGCGNGSTGAWMQSQGIEVTGIDYSESGIAEAKRNHPGVRLERGSAYDDLAENYGQFPAVVSLEVVEHLYDPRRFTALWDGGHIKFWSMATLGQLLQEAGFVILNSRGLDEFPCWPSR